MNPEVETREARSPIRPERTTAAPSGMRRAKTALAVVGVALLVVAIGRGLAGALSGLDGIANPKARVIPPDPLVAPDGPPPDFGPPPTPQDRVTHWLHTLTVGDQDDIAWALRQIERGGAPARAQVIAAAERSVQSNSAFVQHVVRYLADHPGDDALVLARTALESRDQHLATGAATLLAAIGPPAALEAVPQLGLAARDRGGEVARASLGALARIGGPEALAAIRDVLPELGSAYRGYAYLALAESGAPGALEYLEERFAAEDQDALQRLLCAEALARLGDRSAEDWLVAQLEKGSADAGLRPAVLRVLSSLRHRAAFVAVSKELRGLASDERKEELIELLRPYPLTPEVEALLSEMTGPDQPETVRVGAHELLARAGAHGAVQELVRMLGHAGEDGAADRNVAALTLGRLRLPDALDALVAAYRRAYAGHDARTAQFTARAIALLGTPEAAEPLARAFVEDHGDYAVGGVAFGAWNSLGTTRPEFDAAFGAAVERALAGEFGELSGSGLQHLLLAAAHYSQSDLTPVLAERLRHEDAPIRQSAAIALSEVGRQGAKAALEGAWRKREDATTREVIRVALERLHYRAE